MESNCTSGAMNWTPLGAGPPGKPWKPALIVHTLDVGFILHPVDVGLGGRVKRRFLKVGPRARSFLSCI